MDPSSISNTPSDATADSSPAVPATAEAQPSQDSGVPAVPPAAEPKPAEQPEQLLRDALAQVVAPEKKAEPEKPAEPKAEKPADPKADGKKLAEDDPDADANLPFGKHPRWKKVIGENRELRGFRDAAAPRLQEYDRIVGFMQQNDITPEEMQGLYVLGAMLKNDPAGALKTLREIIAPLEAFTGDKLPEDLASEVEEGSLSNERAREIVRSRSETQFRAERERRAGELAAERQQHETSVLLHSQANAVSEWEKQVAASDPDYPLMQELVVMELTRLQRANPARDVGAAIGLAETAYKSIKAKFRHAVQRDRPETPRGPSSRDTPASSGRPAVPASMLDAIRTAL